MNYDFTCVLKTYDYLIKSVIKKLMIYENYEEFYHVGAIALFIAYETYDVKKDKNQNFEVYAYYTILNHLKNELKSINKYKKIEICIDLYQNSYLAPIMENDIIERIELEDLLKNLNSIQQKILKLKRAGYSHEEIGKLLDLSIDQVRYQIKLAFAHIKEIVNKINVN